MYVLTFNPNTTIDKIYFEVLYEAWVIGSHLDPRGPLQDRNWSWDWMMKVEEPVSAGFQAIGRPTSCGRKLPTDDLALTLIKSDKDVGLTLDDEQFKLICRRFGMVPWGVARLTVIKEFYNRLVTTPRYETDKAPNGRS